MADSYNTFPRQKLSKFKKTKKWREACVDAGLHLTSVYDSTRRSSKYKKLRNYNLYNGKFDIKDLEYVVDPYGVKKDGFEFPANMQFYPIATPIFDVLFGEEIKRPFSHVVRAINEQAISGKEKKKKKHVQAMLQEALGLFLNEDKSLEQFIQEEITNSDNYEYQDMREHAASNILEYLKRDLDINRMFNKGWEDALLAGEEIYKAEIIAGEPSLKRKNPIEIYALLPHNEDTLDDAEIIVEETWMNLSEIVDHFYDHLTPSQIDELERDEGNRIDAIASTDITSLPGRAFIGLSDGDTSTHDSSSYYDQDGNTLVRTVTWKSKKKVGELTYIDEMGMEQSTMVDESYKKVEGEKISWFWINEYWEGTKIGHDIFVDIKPKEVQFRRMGNLSKCCSGYIGTVYNANNSQSVSLMDRLVPWIYMYTIMWYRTELLIAANQGKIALIDLALIPPGWEIEKWLYYASAMKFGFVDSFAEGMKGQSQGQLAGNISTQNKVLDLETGQAIQGHVQLLEFIESKIKELAGTPDQRLGAIAASEQVGNTKRAVTQASHITEKWFEIHNWTKQRALTALVEVAKEAWKGNDKKLQYVTDTLGTVFFNVDSNEFTNADYGVFVSNTPRDAEALQELKALTHAAMQNDAISLSSVADILSTSSMADIRATLRKSEKEQSQKQQQMQEMQQQSQEKMQQMQMEQAEKELQKDYYKIDKDNDTKIQVAEINSFKHQEDQDSNDNGIPDQLEIAKLKANVEHNKEKLNLEEKKLKQTEKIKEKEFKLKKEQLKKQQSNKNKK